MNKYSGNNKPYTYVSFPEGKKEKALSILEKLAASDEGKSSISGTTKVKL